MEKLAISFSGGRTSAVMTRICLEKYSATKQCVVTFANTGCEHPETLEFVNNCDKNWAFKTVWLEAVVSPEKGTGIRHKIVDYSSASRDGKPFEDVIAKYGIPNADSPQCTSRLKIEVMESYLKSIGFTRSPEPNYDTAIGIRADEADRIGSGSKKNRIIYPLIELGYTKQKVLNEMSEVEWDLKIPGEHYGNCVWCWKKSFRKLLTVASESPDAFSFPTRMENQYGDIRARDGKKRVFFRKKHSAEDILSMSKMPFDKYTEGNDGMKMFDFTSDVDEMDIGSSCGESCEAYSDESMQVDLFE